MGFQGGSWWVYFRSSYDQPHVTWALIKRVFRFAQPYQWKIAAMLLTILVTTGVSLLTPLIFRDLIDYTLPFRDISRLNLLAIALVLIPTIIGLIRVWERKL